MGCCKYNCKLPQLDKWQIGLLWPFNVNKNYLSIYTWLPIVCGHVTKMLVSEEYWFPIMGPPPLPNLGHCLELFPFSTPTHEKKSTSFICLTTDLHNQVESLEFTTVIKLTPVQIHVHSNMQVFAVHVYKVCKYDLSFQEIWSHRCNLSSFPNVITEVTISSPNSQRFHFPVPD